MLGQYEGRSLRFVGCSLIHVYMVCIYACTCIVCPVGISSAPLFSPVFVNIQYTPPPPQHVLVASML